MIKNIHQTSKPAVVSTAISVSNTIEQESTQTPSIITLSPSEFLTKSSTFVKPLGTHTQTNTPKPITTTLNTANAVAAIASNTNKVQSITKKAVYIVKSSNASASASTALSQNAKVLVHTAGGRGHNESASTASSIGETSSDAAVGQMEHSYMRDTSARSSDISNGLAPARTVLVRRPPQCPSCHTHPLDEQELNETNHSLVPSYDEIAAKEAMHECARIAKYVKNQNSDEDDWEAGVSQIGWTSTHQTLFAKVVRILDLDQLARLANESRVHEAIQRRNSIDKSATRMRRALASVGWEPRITQWLHSLLMDHLPSTYMASYLDIMQTLKTKLPTLTDKMLFSRPLNVSQELLAPVMKRQWEPIISPRSRQLAHNAIMVALPTLPTTSTMPERMQNWYKNLSTITQIVQISLPNSNERISRQSLEQVAETIVSLTRVKIHDLRSENPNRGIILIGFNAGAAMALQVAISESVACVICMGFAYNTLNGVRGNPDDRLLDIKAPILFVIGQNSTRTSQEEMELLRERMQSESSLVVVGSADDSLRVPKSRRKIENVTQAMVDSMVVDEVYDYINRTLTNPPGPRLPSMITNSTYYKQSKSQMTEGKLLAQNRKRKQDGGGGAGDGDATPAKTKFVTHIGRPRTRPLITTTGNANATNVANKTQTVKQVVTTNANEELNVAMQSILGDDNETDTVPSATTAGSDNVVTTVGGAVAGGTFRTVNTIGTLSKPSLIATGGGTGKTATLTPKQIKMIPSKQFVQLKALQPQSKIYTIKPGQSCTTMAGTNIGSIVKTMPTAATTGQQQIFTLKSPNGQTTQFVTAAPASAQQKYTVIKNPNGSTTLQLTKNVTAANAAATTTTTTAAAAATTATGGAGNSNLDLSNINDMPIIFADGDSSLGEGQQQQQSGERTKLTSAGNKSGNSSNVGKLIISQKIIKEANPTTPALQSLGSGGTIITTAAKPFILNKSTTLSALGSSLNAGNNKVVYLNRSTMKPCTNLITRTPGGTTTSIPHYAKFVISNSKGDRSGTDQPTILKAVSLQGLKTSLTPSSANVRQAGLINMGNKIQLINASNATGSGGADKPQIRNIVLKSGGFKQIPQHLGNQLLNRNLTVRKLNLMPTTKITGTNSISTSSPSTLTSPSSAVTVTASSSVSGATSTVQTSAKFQSINKKTNAKMEAQSKSSEVTKMSPAASDE